MISVASDRDEASMDALNHWTFWATAFLIVATPGTGAIYTMAAGLSQGPRAGVWAAFASTLGIVPHVAAALTGLAALLHASAVGCGGRSRRGSVCWRRNWRRRRRER